MCLLARPLDLFLIIMDAATLSHLPGDMLEACGPPVIAKSGADIIAAIERS
jgi:hypothetical protein